MGSIGLRLLFAVIWIIISIGVGWWGLTLTDSSGFVGIAGWIVFIVAWLFGWSVASHHFRILSNLKEVMKMMKEDPEAYRELNNEYQEALKRTEQDDKGE